MRNAIGSSTVGDEGIVDDELPWQVSERPGPGLTGELEQAVQATPVV